MTVFDMHRADSPIRFRNATGGFGPQSEHHSLQGAIITLSVDATVGQRDAEEPA
jgi:hypothetical protein